MRWEFRLQYVNNMEWLHNGLRKVMIMFKSERYYFYITTDVYSLSCISSDHNGQHDTGILIKILCIYALTDENTYLKDEFICRKDEYWTRNRLVRRPQPKRR